MRIAAIYRLVLTWVTLPVSLLVGLLYVGTFTPSGTGVPLAEQATAFLTGAIVLPIICLGAAMSASRLRRARLLDGSATVRRSWLHVFAALVLPPAVAGVVAFLAPVMWFTQAQTGSLLPHPIMVAAAAAHAATRRWPSLWARGCDRWSRFHWQCCCPSCSSAFPRASAAVSTRGK